MGFDDLEQAMEDQNAQSEQEDSAEEPDTTEASPETDTEREQESDSGSDKATHEREEQEQQMDSTDEASTSETESDLQQKAFSYAEAKQSPIYARQAAWNAFDDAMNFDVKRELSDRGIRNVDKRELHETMLYVAAENPELMVERFLELRRDE